MPAEVLYDALNFATGTTDKFNRLPRGTLDERFEQTPRLVLPALAECAQSLRRVPSALQQLASFCKIT